MRRKLLLMLSGLLYVCLIASMGLMLVGCGSAYDQSFENTGYIIEDVYHDQGYLYMSNPEPDTTEDVTVRVRVRRGARPPAPGTRRRCTLNRPTKPAITITGWA